jgi:hypothetical protein
MALREVGGSGGQNAGPSTALRFAQDGKSLGGEKTNTAPFDKLVASSSTMPFGMELREVALRMTHLYWYWSVCPFADEDSFSRMASLLYVDAN